MWFLISILSAFGFTVAVAQNVDFCIYGCCGLKLSLGSKRLSFVADGIDSVNKHTIQLVLDSPEVKCCPCSGDNNPDGSNVTAPIPAITWVALLPRTLILANFYSGQPWVPISDDYPPSPAASGCWKCCKGCGVRLQDDVMVQIGGLNHPLVPCCPSSSQRSPIVDAEEIM